jgi:putative oxidoreductase
MRFALLRDVALLVARVGVGVVFVAHGWQKFATWGIDGTASSFADMGIPLPQASAWFAALVELVGGGALIVGAAVPVFGLLLALNMAGALVLVHASSGVFVDQGGFELVAALGSAALVLAAVGAGRWSLDGLVAPRLAYAGQRAPERTPERV